MKKIKFYLLFIILMMILPVIMAHAAKGPVLKRITVARYALEPEFSPEVFEYKLEVAPGTKMLNVTANWNEGDTYVVEGASSIGVGYSDVKVIVTSPDGLSNTYLLKVYKPVSAEFPEGENGEITVKTYEQNKGNERIAVLSILSVSVLIALGYVAFYFIYKKRGNNNGQL